MSHQADLQGARRRRQEGLSGPARVKRERRRQAELLVAQTLDALAQRDALIVELEARAGRCLVEIRLLGCLSSSVTADACGISVREASRLRHLADEVVNPVDMSATAPTLGPSGDR